MIPVQNSGNVTSGKNPRQFEIGCIIVIISLLLFLDKASYAQSFGKVQNYDINGLKLGMRLDEIITLYHINNIKTIRDQYGIISGYEVRKIDKNNKDILLLNFTGEKRLYRVHHSSFQEQYRYRSQELFEALMIKYGKPWTENRESLNPKKTIYACWGSSCKTYPHITPILTAKIFHSTGRMELMLSDNRIFKRDWILYKQKTPGKAPEKGKATPEVE